MTSFARSARALDAFHIDNTQMISNLLSDNDFLQDAPAITSEEIAALTAAVCPRVRASAGALPPLRYLDALPRPAP
jgi:hypothetical protein